MELNKIYNCDCLEFMKSMPDKSVDLVLTDPPYGIKIAKNGSVGGGSERGKTQIFNKIEWDYNIPSSEYFENIFRISKNQIIFGGNYYTENLKNTRCYLVWYKRDGLPDRTFADCELAWTSFNRNAKVYNIRWDGFIRDSKESKVEHPTQKPILLFSQILKDFSSPSDLIFDPFMGSGTTAVAAYQLGRNFIGCEISAEYCRIANKRLEDARNNLFETANQAGRNEAV